jgi:hypothetical protein
MTFEDFAKASPRKGRTISKAPGLPIQKRALQRWRSKRLPQSRWYVTHKLNVSTSRFASSRSLFNVLCFFSEFGCVNCCFGLASHGAYMVNTIRRLIARRQANPVPRPKRATHFHSFKAVVGRFGLCNFCHLHR